MILNEWDPESTQYKDRFERHFIDETAAYYEARAEKFLKQHGVEEYMSYADVKLEDELHRARKYLEVKTDSVDKVFTGFR